MSLLKRSGPVKTAGQEVTDKHNQTLGGIKSSVILTHLAYRHHVGLLLCGYPLIGMLAWLTFRVF